MNHKKNKNTIVKLVEGIILPYIEEAWVDHEKESAINKTESRDRQVK